MPQSLHTLQDWLDWQESLHSKDMDFDLERLKSIFNRLSISSLAKKTVIVAGTNGKGSCVAMLQSIYAGAGYKVGTYTSPHLLRYNERININGEMASDEQIINAFQKIESIRDEQAITYFEYGTLAAFVCFAESELDIAILEVGLGGRQDATNIIDADAAILASFSYDHQAWLGDTLEEIAYEKAGVLRSGQPSFCGHYNPPITLESHADGIEANLQCIGQHFDIQIDAADWYIHQAPKGKTLGPFVYPKLNGEHQFRNAACVVNVCQAWNDVFPVSNNDINRGLASTELAGRCEIIAEKPKVIIDVAHNKGAIDELKSFLDTLPPLKGGAKCYVLLAILKDKKAIDFFEALDAQVEHWFFSEAQFYRSLSARTLKSQYIKYSGQADGSSGSCSAHKNIRNALKALEKKAGADDRVLIIGSFYTVSEALEEARSAN